MSMERKREAHNANNTNNNSTQSHKSGHGRGGRPGTSQSSYSNPKTMKKAHTTYPNSKEPSDGVFAGEQVILGDRNLTSLDSKGNPRKNPGEMYNPNTTDHMNYFAFETDVRQKMKELVAPIVKSQSDEKRTLEEHKVNFAMIEKRLALVEGIFSNEKGKMKVFDDMHNKLNDADVERLRFIAQTTDQMESLIHRQEKVETKTTATVNQVHINGVLLDAIKNQQSQNLLAQSVQNKHIMETMTNNYKINSDDIHALRLTCDDLQEQITTNKDNHTALKDIVDENFSGDEETAQQLDALTQMVKELKKESALENLQLQRFSEVEKLFLKVEYCLFDLKNKMLTSDEHIDEYLNKVIHKYQKKINQLSQRSHNGSPGLKGSSQIGGLSPQKRGSSMHESMSSQGDNEAEEKIGTYLAFINTKYDPGLIVSQEGQVADPTLKKPNQKEEETPELTLNLRSKSYEIVEERKYNSIGQADVAKLTIHKTQSEQYNKDQEEKQKQKLANALNGNFNVEEKVDGHHQAILEVMEKSKYHEVKNHAANKLIDELKAQIGEVVQKMKQQDKQIHEIKHTIASLQDEEDSCDQQQTQSNNPVTKMGQNLTLKMNILKSIIDQQLEAQRSEIDGLKNHLISNLMESEEKMSKLTIKLAQMHQSQNNIQNTQVHMNGSQISMPEMDIKQQIHNLAKVVVVLVENSLIDSAMNHQKAQHQSINNGNQEFTVPASSEVKTPLAEPNDFEIPSASNLVMNNNPHRRIKSYSSIPPAHAPQASLPHDIDYSSLQYYTNQSFQPKDKRKMGHGNNSAFGNPRGSMGAQASSKGLIILSNIQQQNDSKLKKKLASRPQSSLRPGTSQQKHSIESMPLDGASNANSNFSFNNATQSVRNGNLFIYNNQMFQQRQLTKLQGLLVKKCWSKFQGQSPFSNREVNQTIMNIYQEAKTQVLMYSKKDNHINESKSSSYQTFMQPNGQNIFDSYQQHPHFEVAQDQDFPNADIQKITRFQPQQTQSSASPLNSATQRSFIKMAALPKYKDENMNFNIAVHLQNAKEKNRNEKPFGSTQMGLGTGERENAADSDAEKSSLRRVKRE